MKQTIKFFRQISAAAIFGLFISVFSVSAATFTVTNTNDSGAGSLRQAVLDSNTAATSDNIVFDASFNVPQTITLANVITIDPANGDTLTITGPGANLLTVSGNNAVGIFVVGTGDTASFSGMTLTAGNVAAGSGAAIGCFGNITVTDVTFTANHDPAIDFNNATGVSSITNSRFIQNLSQGVQIDSGTVSVSNSIFNQNGSSAIVNGGTLTVTNSSFDSNTSIYGGAIYSGGLLDVSNSTFTNNTATSQSATGQGGGAIHIFSEVTPVSATITNSVFTGNMEVGSSGGGGAIRNRSGIVNITGSTFTGNSARRDGGAIANSAVMTISTSTFTGNSSVGTNSSIREGMGGAIGNGWQLTIKDSLLYGNSAVHSGGGIWFNNPNSGATILDVTNCTISGNRASGGGGIYHRTNGSTTVTNSTITGNLGSGLVIEFITINLKNSIVANNTANASSDIFGSITSQGYNLIGNASSATIGGTTTGNIIGVDPLLGPLSFNGGPTRTHALRTGSPAIDAGDPTVFPATDQRGISRPQDGDGTGGARSDIGAYERRPNDTVGSGTFCDFDGDGKTDIGIFRPALGEWWINLSSNNQITAAQFGTSTDKIVSGDYTGDGKNDIAIFRPSSGHWFILKSEDFSFYSFPFGNSSDIPVPADFDGDGKTDAAVFRPSTRTWFINQSSDGIAIKTFGVNGDLPVVADYDGDGKADIAIFRPSVGEWWIERSSNLTAFAVQFGLSTDKPVQGDFTGDGKADIVFFRPSNGNWFVLRSEDFSFYSFPFGTSTDIPAPGDYDGDGRFDAAVFRPSSATWYINRSSAGLFIQGFGASGDLPVASAFIP